MSCWALVLLVQGGLLTVPYYRPGPPSEGRGVRVAALAAGVTLWLEMLAVIEILSPARAFRFETVGFVWMAGSLVLMAVTIRGRHALKHGVRNGTV